MEEYGTLQVKRTNQSTMKKVLLGLALVAIVGFSGSKLYSQSSFSTLDTTRDKARMAPAPGVREKAQEVIPADGETPYLRYAVFGFNGDKSAVIPLMQGLASYDWSLDFDQFVNAVPEDSISASVYNFEYWESEDVMVNRPVLITYEPLQTNDREVARMGYFLGSVVLATKGVDDHVALVADFAHSKVSDLNYYAFCTTQMDINPNQCSLEKAFHNCPFDQTHPNSPCNTPQCNGAEYITYPLDGINCVSGSDLCFAGVISTGCCNKYRSFCAANPDELGCHPTTTISLEKWCEDTMATPPVAQAVPLILPESFQLCLEHCQQPCALFENREDTWKDCAGCPTSGLPDPDNFGLTFKCHQDSLGFEKKRCCGDGALCAEALSQSELACEALEYAGCAWVDHLECPAAV